MYHGIFLELWNTTKSLSNIWKPFSRLLDKLHTYLQDRTANPAHLSAIICPVLIYTQKATMEIRFPRYFWNPLIKYTWEIFSNVGQNVCCISPLWKHAVECRPPLYIDALFIQGATYTPHRKGLLLSIH